MRSSPKDTSVTGGSAKNAKYHIAIVRTVKQILSCESKHSQRPLIIATEPLKSGDHCRPVNPRVIPNALRIAIDAVVVVSSPECRECRIEESNTPRSIAGLRCSRPQLFNQSDNRYRSAVKHSNRRTGSGRGRIGGIQ